KIIEYLDLDDQLNLWQAAEPTTRLSTVITSAWQRRKKFFLDGDSFEGPELLNGFLQCICSTVTELRLSYLPMDQLELWRPHTFPELRELCYLADENSDDHVEDEDLAILVGCFPNLESLGMSGNSFGNHISRWRELRRLDLQLCWYLSIECFEEICRNLPLQTLSVQWQRSQEDAYVQAIALLKDLEELELDIVHLSPHNIRQVLGLPKLRKLRIHNFDYLDDLLADIGQIRGRDVVAATCNDNIYMRTPEVMAKLENLRSLTLVDDEGCCAIDFGVIINCFPQLEQLHLLNSRIWPNADGIWSVVAACPKLTHFAISNMTLYEEFFAFSASAMKRVLDPRDVTLEMNFSKNEMESLISKTFVHPNLRLSFGSTDNAISTVPQEAIELELLPLQS
ncbi:hypothetical protein KR018_001761, partial [Drosophila ironensis]